MNEVRRSIKRTEIALVWLFLFAIIIWAVYKFFAVPKAVETCFDNIKDQKEEGVDCGGICPPCTVIKDVNVSEVKLFKFDDINYRVIFEANNTNPDIAYKKIDFKVSFYGDNLKVVDVEYFSDYVNQFEKKFILSPKFPIVQNVSSAKAEVLSVSKNDNKIIFLKNLILEDEKLEVQENNGFKEIVLNGVLLNDTNLNYNEVQVLGILYDKNKEIYQANSTVLFNIEAFKRRDFKITLPYKKDLDLNNVSIYSYINLSKNSETK